MIDRIVHRILSVALFGLMVAAAACRTGQSGAPLPGAREAFGRREPAVYAALLDTIFPKGRPRTLMVDDITITFKLPSRDPNSSWSARFDVIPATLSGRLAELSAAPQLAEVALLGASARPITGATLDDVFHDGSKGWMEFYRRFPGSRGYLALSPIAFSDDESQALIYFERHCGGLCGEGELAWLWRDRPGHWQVLRLLRFWVS